jgi:hypothetical protein
MDDAERRRRIEEKLLEELATGEIKLWWLSFADETGFKGVVILKALGMAHAIKRSHQLGINPGGEVMGYTGDFEDIPEALHNRLLNKADLAGFVVSTKDGS